MSVILFYFLGHDPKTILLVYVQPNRQKWNMLLRSIYIPSVSISFAGRNKLGINIAKTKKVLATKEALI